MAQRKQSNCSLFTLPPPSSPRPSLPPQRHNRARTHLTERHFTLSLLARDYLITIAPAQPVVSFHHSPTLFFVLLLYLLGITYQSEKKKKKGEQLGWMVDGGGWEGRNRVLGTAAVKPFRPNRTWSVGSSLSLSFYGQRKRKKKKKKGRSALVVFAQRKIYRMPLALTMEKKKKNTVRP